MATALPPKLKAAAPDVQRFATRAAQLEKFRPIVTYWCEYYILQQILSRQLHATDEECTQYAVQLMDKLESYKSANTSNDAVVDDVAAKAYVENFALDTFNKADDAQRTNKVTKQTADTFQASATFMDLLTIWGQLEPEIQAKQKFAKFHVLRIAKAIKAGEDPNATNPVVPSEPEPGAAMDEGLEAELKNLENDAGVYKQPTVESAPDSGLPSRPHSALQNDSIEPPPAPPSNMIPPPTTSSNAIPPVAPLQNEPDVSPIEPNDDVNSRAGSIGGGYFPAVPGAHTETSVVSSVDQPRDATSNLATTSPGDFYSAAPPPARPSPGDFGVASPHRPSAPTPHQMTSQPPVAPSTHSSQLAPHVPAPVQATPSTVRSAPTGPPPGGYKTDDDSVMAAQKHAKWAISALNFEDVNTAVKELRIALQSLGAN